jgi:hypothetical protein
LRRTRLAVLITLLLAPRGAWPQGNPLGPEFRVNTYTTDDEGLASVAADSLGNFVVVWVTPPGLHGLGRGGPALRQLRQPSRLRVPAQQLHDEPPEPSFRGLRWTRQFRGGLGERRAGRRGRRHFRAALLELGQPRGSRVPGQHVHDRHPAGSGRGRGRRRQLRDHLGQQSPGRVELGRLRPALRELGRPAGPEFRVNTYSTNSQYWPAVAADSAGNVVVAWQSFDSGGAAYEVRGQRYASSGSPLGPEFPVNGYVSGNQARPSVAADASGNFAVVWSSIGQDGSGSGIVDGSGSFVVVWHSDGQDGSGYGVFGQRYGQIVPVELMHFRVE